MIRVAALLGNRFHTTYWILADCTTLDPLIGPDRCNCAAVSEQRDQWNRSQKRSKSRMLNESDARRGTMTDPERWLARVSGIAEVARLAGVSKSTASRALGGTGYVSDDTRRRVDDAAADDRLRAVDQRGEPRDRAHAEHRRRHAVS